MSSFQDLLKFAAVNQKKIKSVFNWTFVAFGVFLAVSAWMIFFDLPGVLFLYQIGPYLGQLSIIFFILTTSTGILRRFGFNHPLISINTLFRRQTGLMSFYLGLAHACILYIFPTITTGVLPTLLPAYIYGSIALSFMFGLALTSNDWLQAAMGKWWKRFHRVVYFIYWMIFLHVMMHGSGWMYVIGPAAVLEVVSLIYVAVKPKPMAAPVAAPAAQTAVSTPAVPSPKSSSTV